MTGIFSRTRPAPLSMRVGSKEGCSYLYRAMKCLGWLPPQRGIKRYVYLLWTCFIFAFSETYLNFGYALSIAIDFKNLTSDEFLGLLHILLCKLGQSTKSINALILFYRLGETESVLDNLDELLQSDSDRRKIHKAVALSNYVFLVYWYFYFGYSLSMLMAGIWSGQPPWLIYNPLFDWRQGVYRFWLQTILEYMVMTPAVMMNLVWDALPVVYMVIFRAHVDALKDNIRNLRTDPHQSEAENYDKLVSCVIRHKLILKCCDLMRPVISRLVFIQFLLAGLLLGLAMAIALNSSDIFRKISAVIFLVAALMETFPFCYLCDLLVLDSEELSNLLGQSHWIDAEPKYKSTLRIFMQQVQQPIIFIAGGIFAISISTNFQMTKFAFSVVTIVQQMNLADRFTELH